MDKMTKITTLAFADERRSEDTCDPPETAATTSFTTSTTQCDRTISRRRLTIQNFLLVWLDENMDESADHFHDSINYLRRIINIINTFTDVDTCVDFLSQINDEKVFMIVSSALEQKIVPRTHDMPQIVSICTYGENSLQHEQWAKNWCKLNGIFTQIDSVCEVFKQATRQCEQDSVSMSFVAAGDISTNQNLNQLDQSYMYTQILKEILFDIDYDEQSVKDLAAYCRKQYDGNDFQLKKIDEFEQEYRNKSPIWWYTREGFLYFMLNRALRTQEVDIITKMGFFIRDLHQQIDKLHSEQFNDHNSSLTVYRGQCLMMADFEKLMRTKNGMMSFNNFLSTSKDRLVSLAFAEGSRSSVDAVGILFKMTIDLSLSTAPFAFLDNVSYYRDEEEILFSTHTVFRIHNIKQIDDNDNSRLWEVELTLTEENDQHVHALTQKMREETFPESKGWSRLGELFIVLGELDEAEQVYRMLLNQTSEDTDKATIYHQLGRIRDSKGDYAEAVSLLEKALEIKQGILPPNHPRLAASYNNIGSTYYKMHEYSKALSYHETALKIKEKILPEDHPSLASSFNNIGNVFYDTRDYLKALSFYQKAIKIRQETLPENHPDLGTSYNNIGLVYEELGEFMEALSFHEKAFEIRQRTLPPSHPDLAKSYGNIGLVYNKMGDYSKALISLEKSCDSLQKALPSYHPDLAASYNNIGLVNENIGEYLKALASYEKALEIRQKAFHLNFIDLGTSYNNIGNVYFNNGEYETALTFYERAVEHGQHSLSSHHPMLQRWRRHMEFTKNKIQII